MSDMRLTPQQFALLAKLVAEGINKILLPGATYGTWCVIKDEIHNRPEFRGEASYYAIEQLGEIYAMFKTEQERAILG